MVCPGARARACGALRGGFDRSLRVAARAVTLQRVYHGPAGRGPFGPGRGIAGVLARRDWSAAPDPEPLNRSASTAVSVVSRRVHRQTAANGGRRARSRVGRGSGLDADPDDGCVCSASRPLYRPGRCRHRAPGAGRRGVASRDAGGIGGQHARRSHRLVRQPRLRRSAGSCRDLDCDRRATCRSAVRSAGLRAAPAARLEPEPAVPGGPLVRERLCGDVSRARLWRHAVRSDAVRRRRLWVLGEGRGTTASSSTQRRLSGCSITSRHCSRRRWPTPALR